MLVWELLFVELLDKLVRCFWLCSQIAMRLTLVMNYIVSLNQDCYFIIIVFFLMNDLEILLDINFSKRRKIQAVVLIGRLCFEFLHTSIASSNLFFWKVRDMNNRYLSVSPIPFLQILVFFLIPFRHLYHDICNPY